MIGVDAKVNIVGALKRFESVRRVDQRKIMTAAKKPVRESLREIAKTQASPSGRWKGLASSTKARRARGGSPSARRRVLGRLPNARKITSGVDFVRGESLVRWSGAHQRGGRVGRGTRLIARDFMWIPRKLVKAVKDVIRKGLYEAWKAGR